MTHWCYQDLPDKYEEPPQGNLQALTGNNKTLCFLLLKGVNIHVFKQNLCHITFCLNWVTLFNHILHKGGMHMSRACLLWLFIWQSQNTFNGFENKTEKCNFMNLNMIVFCLNAAWGARKCMQPWYIFCFSWKKSQILKIPVVFLFRFEHSQILFILKFNTVPNRTSRGLQCKNVHFYIQLTWVLRGRNCYKIAIWLRK